MNGPFVCFGWQKTCTGVASERLLVDVVHFDDDHTNILIARIIVDLGDVPIAGKENEKSVGCAVVELGTPFVITVMYNIFSGIILAIGCAGVMVYESETLDSFHDILKVDVMTVAFTPSFLKRFVVGVFHAGRERGALNEMPALWDVDEVGCGKPFEECLPLCRILLILPVKLREVDTPVR